MNKKNLAIKISKHPLIKKLLESKFTSSRVIARVIVEELTEAPARGEFYVGKKGSPGLRVRNRIKGVMDDAVKKGTKEAIKKASERISNFPETFNIEGVSEEHLEILKKFSESTVSRGAEQIQILQAAEKANQSVNPEDNEEVEQAQQQLDQEVAAVEEKVDQALKDSNEQVDAEKVVSATAQVLVDLDLDREFVTTYNQNEQAGFKIILDNAPKEIVDVLNTSSEETQEKITQAVNNELEQNAGEKIDSEEGEPEQSADAPEEPTAETEPAEEPEEETRALEIDEETKREFESAYREMAQEFYNKPYKKDQAKIIQDLLTILGTIKTEENIELEAAAQRTPREPIQEAAGQVTADKKELRNVKLSLQAFLGNVKKSKQLLQKFINAAKEGRVISDFYKDSFMDILRELQKDVRDLVKYLLELIGPQNLQELKTKEQIMDEWKQIEQIYDETVTNLGSLNSIIVNGQSGNVDELFSDAFANLLELGTYFPSVNPFGKSKTKDDYQNFETNYDTAINNVKNSLQSVLVLVKKGQQDGPVLRQALKGLKDFSGQIQSIFDVESLFKDKQIKPDEKAAQGDSAVSQDTDETEIIKTMVRAIKDNPEWSSSLSDEETKTLVKNTAPQQFKDDETFINTVTATLEAEVVEDTMTKIQQSEQFSQDASPEELKTLAREEAPESKKDDEDFLAAVVQNLEGFSAEEIRNKTEALENKTAQAYFEEYYKPGEGDIEYAEVSDIMDNVFEFYKEAIGDTTVSESMPNINRSLNEKEKKALESALDKLAENYGNEPLQEFLGFVGQTTIVPIGKSDSWASQAQISRRKKNNAWIVFTQALKAISQNLIKPQRASGTKPKKDTSINNKRKKKNTKNPTQTDIRDRFATGDPLFKEQIANKLKPLIREMLNKGK
jgi:hypothetical protein